MLGWQRTLVERWMCAETCPALRATAEFEKSNVEPLGFSGSF